MRLPARSRTPIFAGSIPALGAAVVLVVLPARADPPPAASVYSRRPLPTVAPGGGANRSEEAAQAERIVAGALLTVGRANSFTARLRQKARIGDRVLVGTGRYVQSGRGEDQRFRYESALECDSESFEMLEVCDGLFCWSFRRAGPEPPSLQRIDVLRVREKLGHLQAPDPAETAPYLGGLQRSLWTMREWFRFTAAEAAVVDGLAVWTVQGEWRPGRLAKLLPALADAARRPGGVRPAELPDGVPWGVRVSVGQGDLVLRRIEWLALPGPRPVADGLPEPIAVLELHDVAIDAPVDATAFLYQPAATGLMDVTEQHVSTLTLLRP